MIITIKSGSDEKQLNELKGWLGSRGASFETTSACGKTLICVRGGNVDEELLKTFETVDGVFGTEEKYKLASAKNHAETVVSVGGKKFGGGNYAFIAGPCSVESEKQIITIAEEVKKAGAAVLRGGAFKPRTSPYDFQGLRKEGLKLLKKAKAETGMPIATEIVDVRDTDDFFGVDLIQIGARNMQNFELLKEAGKLGVPVLLKRGFVNTVDELLSGAEYIMSEGNKNVILCERGIRTFENLTRYTLDLAVIPLLKEKTHLPVIVDPSHATGLSRLVKPASLAAAVVADGVMVEVHNDPKRALCDGAQAITSEEFAEIVAKTEGILSVIGGKNL